MCRIESLVISKKDDKRSLEWILSKPVVTAPIKDATKPHHLDDAVASISVQLTPDEIGRLEEAYQPHPVLGYA
jgi:aryl-alcohol dehydrogenase-like predicted oxidoreductase